MNPNYRGTLVALAAVSAIAFPAPALAKGGHGNGHADHGKSSQHGRWQHGRALIVKGTVSAVGSDGTVQVDVLHANHHGAGLVGQTVTFDASAARVVVVDANGDGQRDLGDVAVGDRVVVQARIAKGETPDPTATISALRLVDQGAPAAPSGGGGSTSDPAGG